MVQGLVLTHGEIGDRLVDAVQMILGPVEGLRAASNRGRSVRQTTDLVTAWLAEQGDATGGLVFIDEIGGSCASAARLAGVEAAGRPVLSGVNLSMLLAFVTWRQDLPVAELAQRIVAHGRQAIAVVGQAR